VPSTVAQVFAAARLEPAGVLRWGDGKIRQSMDAVEITSGGAGTQIVMRRTLH
jgi:hypothetical protein